jgi:hypothetical protein
VVLNKLSNTNQEEQKNKMEKIIRQTRETPPPVDISKCNREEAADVINKYRYAIKTTLNIDPNLKVTDDELITMLTAHLRKTQYTLEMLWREGLIKQKADAKQRQREMFEALKTRHGY